MDKFTVVPPAEGTGTTGYLRVTRTATYGFLFALPLVLLYEVMVRLANKELPHGGVRIGAEVWLKKYPMETSVGQWLQTWLLEHGIGAVLGMVFVVVIIGLGIYLWDRKKRLPFKPGYGFGVVAESAVYAVVVAYIAMFATSSVMKVGAAAVGQEAMQLSMFHEIALSLGAGIYEELLFRVLLTGGLFLVLTLILPRTGAYIIAALVGALLFSWVHYTGELGDVFTWGSFTYRAMGGLILNALFLLRGFGVVAWTHAIYDVYVFTGFFGALENAFA